MATAAAILTRRLHRLIVIPRPGGNDHWAGAAKGGHHQQSRCDGPAHD